MKKLKVYIAGKVSPGSVFGRHDWRDEFCAELTRLSGFEIINLDPTKSCETFNLNENDSMLIVGRDCFMIQSADIVIVNLTDDISVGGSQEMLIAKYYEKPLIGIAPTGGKFSKKESNILGNTYENWKHAFVVVPCDAVVENTEGAAAYIKDFFSQPKQTVKGINVLDETIQYYIEHHHKNDTILHGI